MRGESWSLAWSESDEEEFTHDFKQVLHSCHFEAETTGSPPNSWAVHDLPPRIEEFVRRVSIRADRGHVTLKDAVCAREDVYNETGHRLSIQEVAAGMSILSFMNSRPKIEPRLSVTQVLDHWSWSSAQHVSIPFMRNWARPVPHAWTPTTETRTIGSRQVTPSLRLQALQRGGEDTDYSSSEQSTGRTGTPRTVIMASSVNSEDEESPTSSKFTRNSAVGYTPRSAVQKVSELEHELAVQKQQYEVALAQQKKHYEDELHLEKLIYSGTVEHQGLANTRTEGLRCTEQNSTGPADLPHHPAASICAFGQQSTRKGEAAAASVAANIYALSRDTFIPAQATRNSKDSSISSEDYQRRSAVYIREARSSIGSSNNSEPDECAPRTAVWTPASKRVTWVMTGVRCSLGLSEDDHKACEEDLSELPVDSAWVSSQQRTYDREQVPASKESTMAGIRALSSEAFLPKKAKEVLCSTCGWAGAPGSTCERCGGEHGDPSESHWRQDWEQFLSAAGHEGEQPQSSPESLRKVLQTAMAATETSPRSPHNRAQLLQDIMHQEAP